MEENDLTKLLLMNELFDLYGELLPSRQKKVFVDYYENNYSLSEIAQNENISKNAVYDALKKAEDSLKEYENILKLNSKRNNFEKKIKKLKLDKHIDEYAYKNLTKEDF